MPTLDFKLPDVGEGVAEAEIAGWHVKPGDDIKEDQPFVDVMTDKATVEITSPITGRVRAIHFEAGIRVAIGSIIAVFDVGDTHAPEVRSQSAVATASNDEPPRAQQAQLLPGSVRADPTPARPRERPLTSPAIRRRAKELGLSLDQISGSGRRGRITRSDLEAHIAQATAARSTLPRESRSDTGIEEIKVIGLRRQIAERMSIAKRRIPHFSYIEEVDVTELERLRQQLNTMHSDRPKLTVLPFVIRALVRTLPSFPQMNATFDDEAGIVRRHRAVHVGVATQTPQGLLVPVLRNAETLDLWNAARTIAANANIARTGKAGRDLLTGSTITVTSLGALGGVATTPVINHPEVAIVGPNKIIERPVVIDGAIAVRKMMNLSSSFDHRVVDGFDAAEFVQSIKRLLETPALLFVDQPQPAQASAH